MKPTRNHRLTISLGFFEAEKIVELDKSLRLSAQDENPDANQAESDLADSEWLAGLCEEAIIGGTRSDAFTDHNEVILLAKAMMKIAS